LSSTQNFDPPGGRVEQLQERPPPTVDLPHPLSPTSPKVSPRFDVEGDAVDGIDIARGHGRIPLGGWGNAFSGLELRAVEPLPPAVLMLRRPARVRRASRRSSDPDRVAAGAGKPRDIRQWPVRKRGAKAQPAGRLASEGTIPLISFSRAWRTVVCAAVSTLGMEPSNPLVYGWPGPRTDPWRLPPPPCARHTSRPRGRHSRDHPHIMRDQDDRGARAGLEVPASSRESGPGSLRPAQWSARRRSAVWDLHDTAIAIMTR